LVGLGWGLGWAWEELRAALGSIAASAGGQHVEVAALLHSMAWLLACLLSTHSVAAARLLTLPTQPLPPTAHSFIPRLPAAYRRCARIPFVRVPLTS
jgi:hypothetical protein